MRAEKDGKEHRYGHGGRILRVVVVVGIASARVTDVTVGTGSGSVAVAAAGIVRVSAEDLGGRDGDKVRNGRHCVLVETSSKRRQLLSGVLLSGAGKPANKKI
jgi:hypothetical protein